MRNGGIIEMGFQEKPFSIYITNKEGTMEFALIKK